MTKFQLKFDAPIDFPLNISIVQYDVDDIIEKIAFYSNKKTLNISVQITATLETLQDIISDVTSRLNLILDRMTFEFIFPIGNPIMESIHNLDTGEGITHASIHGSVMIPRSISTQQCVDLFNNTRNPPYRADLLSLYRSALQNTGVARFMFLYSILLHVISDNQGNVDNYIISKGYSGPITPGFKRQETIFTKLRNELGHRRDANPSNTRREMEQTVKELAKYVKSAIIDHS